MRGVALLAVVLAAAAPSRAQLTPDLNHQDDAALIRALDKDKKAHDEPTAVAQSLALAFGATFFNEVRISTNGPVIDLSRLSHEGFYKLELIELLLISSKAKKPLSELAAMRRKGKALRTIAFSSGVDYDKIYDSALAVQEIVDRDYLPRFHDRRPRKEREEP
jgi:hypothetical protein